MVRPDKCIFIVLIVFLSSCIAEKRESIWNIIDKNSSYVYETSVDSSIDNKILASFLSKKGRNYLAARQKTSKNNYDFLYSVDLTEKEVDSIINSNQSIKELNIRTRNFNGFQIKELLSKDGEIQAAFVNLDNVLALSRSTFLIENAIRTNKDKSKADFKSSNPALFGYTMLKSDLGNLYSSLETQFSQFILTDSITLFRNMEARSAFDVKADERNILFNGFTIASDKHLLSWEGQTPVSNSTYKYIPNFMNECLHFGFTDLNKIKLNADSIFLNRVNIANEITIAYNEQTAQALAIVELKEVPISNFDFITSYEEAYYNYTIQSVDRKKLKNGFGDIFPPSSFNYSAIKDNFLILSPSLESLKTAIDAIENDETWGKTSEFQKFIDKGLQESNITVIKRNPNFKTTTLAQTLYQSSIDSVRIEKINWYSLQLSALDDHFYSVINIDRSPISKYNSKEKTKSKVIELASKTLSATLVRNYTNNSNEILLQDSLLSVYLISMSEGIRWKKQVKEPINNLTRQLDFYKNNKYQFLFSTKNGVHLIDRLGRYVTGFPVSPAKGINYLNVVDYDKTKNYRYLTALDKEIYLLDKNGKNLSEWGPKKFAAKINSSPLHFKIGGKDHFLVLLDDNSVHVYNRKGDETFSFNLKDTPQGEYYFEEGLSAEKTFLQFVTKDGLIVKQNLKGTVVSSENLPRGKGSSFTMRAVDNNALFYTARIDTDKIVIYDKGLKPLFELPNSGSMRIDLAVNYYGEGLTLFSLFDAEQKMLSVFDQTGRSQTLSPIDSDIMPLISFDKTKNEKGIYSFSGNKIVFTKFD